MNLRALLGSLRTWLLFGTVLDLIVFIPAAMMAFNSVTLAMTYPESTFVIAVAVLFQALPAFCLLCPFAAWRIHRKRPDDINAVIMVAAPLLYAAFLVAFLLAN